ncbi:glycosyltransferase family 2 protein [Erythrobacter alti]|uniref:glycosyltransferase family 2 protein n=1 Tax=Erythrobacter alti TaxID=1896145 RepID=UPI0030F3FA61
MSSPSITAIILTKDEEQHLRRALGCVMPYCREVIVVDSGSTDGTQAIAREMGARWESNAWVNYATQFNHGLELAGETSDWILRLDADEILDTDWYARFSALVAQKPDTAGIALRRMMTFRGKPIRHGLAQTWQLRLFRAGRGHCEARWMDEHIVVDGPVEQLGVQLLDDNLNDLKWWTQKHIGYADREAVDLLLGEERAGDKVHGGAMTGQAKVKRWLKDNVYARLPIGLRALLFFILRYVFALGFLDGLRGFQFHVLQGFWYRLYTDIRLDEIRKLRAAENLPLEQAIFRVTGHEVAPAPTIETDKPHGG